MTDISAIGSKELINREANNFKMELFNDIHEGSGAISVRWCKV